MECINKIKVTAVCLLLCFGSMAQVTTGKITFERRTNLKKRMGDNPRMKNMINDENKIRKEKFALYFDEESSKFEPIEDADASGGGGFMRYMTQKNTTYQNISKSEKLVVLDLWGSQAMMKDSMQERSWKVTTNKRTIADYQCTKAVWEMNDSTRIYAWFSPDIVASVGPEGFAGLPGAILGLATEDGGLIYFATEVVVQELPKGKTDYSSFTKDVYTKESLKATLLEKMGKWIKPSDLDAMFNWL